MSSKKLPVAINVFPTLDYIELVQYDDKAGEIEKAVSLPCQFDLTTRQVANWEQMTQAIRDLYGMNRIPYNTPAVLVLPSFFTREIELLAEFSNEELRFALISEAERFYVFKKSEPQIDWIKLDDGRLLYSAYPKEEIDRYVQIFQENRIPLMGIELGYLNALRGLAVTGAIQEELETQDRWCMLSVSDYSFFASIQSGLKLCKTTEAPLSSLDDNESSAVQEIHQDFENFASGEQFSKLIVVNNASRIQTNDLISGLGMQPNIILIEQNGQTLHSRGAEAPQFPCSLEGIGGVFYGAFPEIARMNFLPETSEDVAGIINLRQQMFQKLAYVNAGVFACCLLLWGIVGFLLWQKEQEFIQLSKQSSSLSNMASIQHVQDLNRKRFVKKALDRNVQINNFLVRTGRLTPTDSWIEKIQVTSDDLLKPTQVVMEGKTLKLDEVNQLRSQLSEVVPESTIEVSKAAPLTSPDGQSYFGWSIQNKATETTNAANGSSTGPNASPPGGG